MVLRAKNQNTTDVEFKKNDSKNIMRKGYQIIERQSCDLPEYFRVFKELFLVIFDWLYTITLITFTCDYSIVS